MRPEKKDMQFHMFFKCCIPAISSLLNQMKAYFQPLRNQILICGLLGVHSGHGEGWGVEASSRKEKDMDK